MNSIQKSPSVAEYTKGEEILKDLVQFRNRLHFCITRHSHAPEEIESLRKKHTEVSKMTHDLIFDPGNLAHQTLAANFLLQHRISSQSPTNSKKENAIANSILGKRKKTNAS